MNKRLKKIVAMALTVCAFSAIEPAQYFSMATTKAYASSGHISEVSLNKRDDDKQIRLYKDDDYDSKTSFRTSKDEYYAKTSLKSVNVSFDTDSDYVTKVFADNNRRSSPFDSGEEIELNSKMTTLYVRTYKESKFDKNDVKDNIVEEYKIYVENTNSSNSFSKDDEDNEDVYLDDLILNDGDIDIDFEKKSYSYDVKVKSSIDEVTIKAKPDDDDFTVKIDNDKVNSRYEKTVDLENNKKNVIKVKVTDDDDNDRTYTLNITRGNVGEGTKTTNDKTSTTGTTVPSVVNIPTNNSSKNTDVNKDTEKNKNEKNNLSSNKNKWVKNAAGKWQYYDEKGSILKNQWFYDNKTYYRWYYLNGNGEMTIGWLKDNYKWYYLNSDGSMVSGWIKPNGIWYYLNGDGSMRTGCWLQEGDKKYYLNADGSMQTGQKIIDNISYTFNEKGQLK